MKFIKYIALGFVSFLLPFAVGTACAIYVASHFITVADQHAEDARTTAKALLGQSLNHRLILNLATSDIKMWQRHDSEGEEAFYRAHCMEIRFALPEVKADFIKNGRSPAFVKKQIEQAEAMLEKLEENGKCESAIQDR